MSTLPQRLQALHARIEAAEHAAGRIPGTVQLLAVSKAQTAQTIRAAHEAGQTAFGENYLQEALGKMAELADLALEWHFIGPVQSNKTRPLAEHFSWVHGVDRLKTAQRLSEARPANARPLNLCLQVNVSGEDSKSGCDPQQAVTLAASIARLPRIVLRGLMAIPQPSIDIALQHRQFKMLRQLLDTANSQGLGLDTLSMGMSHDFPAAIAEGATMVRIGTAIFGPRGATQKDAQ